MSDPNIRIAVVGVDIGKNSFHVVGLDARGAIVLRQWWPRGRLYRCDAHSASGNGMDRPCSRP